uniref:Uncharacterized protein n=1 Tax=Babesia bovis TaxID=5865 RepID=A7AN62_BABBO|eukprot:XP_001611564.1 hypothetical protein [Babesia bovis T2Bo]
MNLGVTLHLIIYLHLSLAAGIQTKAVIRHGGNRIPLKSHCCLTVARSNVDSAARGDLCRHNRATIQKATTSTPGNIHLGPSVAFISHSYINCGPLTPRRLAACRSTDERMCREGEGFEGDTTFDGTVESGSNQTGLTKKQYESLKTLLDTNFPVEPTGDEDEAHPLSDIVLKYWGRKPNPRDALMQNIAKLEKEWEATGSREEACKKLNLPQPIKFKPELISAMLRDMFDLRKEPSTFVENVMAMMGFASRETHAPGDGKWPFGIKPKDASIEKPLTRNALIGYLGVDYYRHLEQLARRDPDIARRILTVIHRMYRAPQLVLDTCENREPTDKEIYMDSDKLKKAQCVVYKEFIKDYPDLQWPVDDQGFLDIYNKWYPEDALELNNTLPDLMKQIYGPGDDIKPPNFFYRFLGIPAVSCAAGALLGGVAAQLINMGTQFIPGLDLQYFVTNKVCGAVIALGTWFGMSRDLKVKGSVFQLALKTLVDNGMKDNTKLRAAAYSGIIPKYDVVTDLERFVIYATIAGFNRALQLVKEGSRSIDTWNTLARQVGRVAEVCLPMCRVSVYRIIYFAACDLASSDLLPCTHGNEVLGKAISGDPEYSDDDYSEIYKEKNAAHGLPPPESFREAHQRTALLFTTFCLQAFGNIKHFTRTSEEQLDRYQEFLRDIKLMKVSDEAWDNLRDQPMQPSLLDDVEKWSRDLERAGGKLKRIALVREYGFNPLDEFMGETAEEKHNRMQIELQEARDAVKDITSPIGYKLELLKAMSIIMFLREEWLLERYRDFIKKQCVEFITNEIEGMSTDIDTKIQSFQIAAAHVAGVKRDAIFALARRWNEENKLDHDKLLELGRAAGISDDIVLDAASAATFNEMLQEMYNWDLTTVTAELLIEIKERYRCRDLVLINALCESIKKQTAEHKKEMVNAKNKYNWNLVEKHMSILLRGKTAVINAAASTIDCKLWYRIDRAFLQNIPFVDKEFTDDEILGTGEIAKISNQDWEMKDPPPPKSDFQQMDEEFQKQLDDIKPLTIYGEDTRTPIHKQLEIIDMVEKGKLDPKFQCIPNVLHVGERPKELEYEIDRKLPEDPYELRRQIVSSRDAYASWVIYCYRKRDVNPNDVKTLLTIFPFLEK